MADERMRSGCPVYTCDRIKDRMWYAVRSAAVSSCGGGPLDEQQQRDRCRQAGPIGMLPARRRMNWVEEMLSLNRSDSVGPRHT